MIAEEYQNEHNPIVSIPRGITVSKILNCFKYATPFFCKILNESKLSKPLNEDKYTQIFVEQIDIQMRRMELCIGVKNQYSDLFFGTRGKPDFYFHAMEEGRISEPIFIVEAKRLPAYTTANEREYVVGKKQNGGLERFKIEKHGKGQHECGMLAFVEENEFSFWHSKINDWIEELTTAKDTAWVLDELITKGDFKPDHCYSKSILHTISNHTLSIHHFWVNTSIL